ncbi:hypothetical protein [Pedobacter nototheniae]|uniref:hypothetical protein n=1 Tax=Pedobacter nototheniae TaxID=2488994 RepID=UPI00292DE805|nr:hypothetical protein [Pedobacter nototheniae]
MKQRTFTLLFLAFFTTLSISCTKEVLLQAEPVKVVQLTITGNTTVDLEYLYKDSVIATTKAGTGGINVKTLLSVKNQTAPVQIRKKGSTDILLSKVVTASPFDQNINIYYDGDKIYNNSVSVQVKGYALSGELEFLLDGNLLFSATAAVNNTVSVLIDNGTTREIQVRKKGETTLLFVKKIESSIKQQNLLFFFDGTKIVDNVKLEPPVNPANMMVSAKFETTFAQYFKMVDVELVLYQKNLSTNVATKPNPEIRFTLPKDGSFNSIELPPLPAGNYIYSFDIVEKGTNNVPYTTTAAPFIAAAYPFKPNDGKYGLLNFEAGKSKLFIIKDSKTQLLVPKGSYLSGIATDLSQYFQ